MLDCILILLCAAYLASIVVVLCYLKAACDVQPPDYGESLDGGQPRKRPRREVGLGEREWMWRHREAGMN